MAGPQPKPTWRKPDDLSDISTITHDFGTVDADTYSAVFDVHVWNNFGGTTAVPDMTDCKITTKDSASGNTSDPVTGKWVQVKVLSANEADYTPIGGSEGIELGTAGSGVFGHEHPIKAKDQAAGIIKGSANTGILTDTANFANLSLKAFVPINAIAGTTNFKLRVNFKYT